MPRVFRLYSIFLLFLDGLIWPRAWVIYVFTPNLSLLKVFWPWCTLLLFILIIISHAIIICHYHWARDIFDCSFASERKIVSSWVLDLHPRFNIKLTQLMIILRIYFWLNGLELFESGLLAEKSRCRRLIYFDYDASVIFKYSFILRFH